MKAFRYERAGGIASACASAAKPGTKFIAGGTNLLDLMKLEIETPAHRRSFATRRRPAGICSSARGAPTSMTRPNPATSARRARAAQPWAASTA